MRTILTSIIAAVAVVVVVSSFTQGYLGRREDRNDRVDACATRGVPDRLNSARGRARDSMREGLLARITRGQESKAHDKSRSEAASSARDFMSRTGLSYDGMDDILKFHKDDPVVRRQAKVYCESVTPQPSFFG